MSSHLPLPPLRPLLPLPTFLLCDIFASLPPKSPYLFPGRHGRGHIHKGSADLILREVCYRLEFEGVSTHSFRRTALTQMSDAGVPLRHIQAISGHRTLSALERYLGVTDKQKQNAIDSLEF